MTYLFTLTFARGSLVAGRTGARVAVHRVSAGAHDTRVTQTLVDIH